MDNAQLSRRALLVVTGSAALATVLASRQVTAAASTQAPNSAPVPLISLTSQASGTFKRVRAVDDDTRLYLSYPGAAGMLTGQRVTAPGYYGLHFTAYPAGHHADQYLQDLFDNTPLGYLGFYFKTIGHPGGSWAGKATGLLTQGWNLVPIYVGRQQYWPHTTDNQISAHTTTAATQGKKDGEKAVTLATSEKLPRHSRLYLDIEATQYTSGPSKGKNGPPTASAIAYMKAWLAAVSASGKYAGALYDVNSRWTQSGTTYYDAVRIHSDLGHAAPTTWVAWNPGKAPIGVKAEAWPRDPNGDVAAVAVKAYSTNPQWDYASFAQSWQFTLNWLPAGAYFLTDTGAPRRYTAIAPGLDFNVSKSDDPGNTAPGHPKSRRRPAVSSVTAGSATVKPGKSVKVTVKLDRPAPAPNGAVVLLRSTSPQLILPSSARVAAKATSVTVSATAAVGSPAGSVTVRARVLHQLSGTPPQTMIKIAP
jgi:Domain of unknown function (DUF1906)